MNLSVSKWNLGGLILESELHELAKHSQVMQGEGRVR